MAQNFGSPITDKTKDAREALRVALGLGTDVPFSDYINHITSQWTPSEIFKDGQKGFWYEPDDISTLSQDATGLVPVTSHNDPIGRVKDKSSNGNHAIQSISARRALYKASPPRLMLDKVDDDFVINVPAGGWVGTMVIATDIGTASYEVDMPSGSYLLGGRYFAGNAIIGVLFRSGSLAENEKYLIEKYFVNKGATESFINNTNFSRYWSDSRFLVEFPIIDTREVKDLSYCWYECDLLKTFPVLNTSKVTSLSNSWSRCSSLDDFPVIDVSSVTNFGTAWGFCSSLKAFPALKMSSGAIFAFTWNGCISLSDFPDNMFDNVKSGNFINAFLDTNLSRKSIDGILTSLVKSGVASGTRRFDQSGGSAPSSIGKTAIDTLRARGWTVSVTGGY